MWELFGNCLGIVWELFGNCLGILQGRMGGLNEKSDPIGTLLNLVGLQGLEP